MSEVQGLLRRDVLTHAVLQVLVGDLPVLVEVHVVKYLFELVFCDVQTPMSEISLDFLWIDDSIFAFVQIRKRLLDAFPLELEFLKDVLHKIRVD